jgi:hypothetical protein
MMIKGLHHHPSGGRGELTTITEGVVVWRTTEVSLGVRIEAVLALVVWRRPHEWVLAEVPCKLFTSCFFLVIVTIAIWVDFRDDLVLLATRGE